MNSGAAGSTRAAPRIRQCHVASVATGSVQTAWNAGPTGPGPNGTVPIGGGALKYSSSPQKPGKAIQAGELAVTRLIAIVSPSRRSGPAAGPCAVTSAGSGRPAYWKTTRNRLHTQPHSQTC